MLADRMLRAGATNASEELAVAPSGLLPAVPDLAAPLLRASALTTGTSLARVRVRQNLVHFSICACHPCTGAMLFFSVSFQFFRMIPEGFRV